VRPQVLCSVFVGGPTDGHGQHATAGLMAQEAFLAAGDPTKFPEQIKEGLQPWKPLKVYARVPNFRVSEKGMYDYATHTWGPVGVTNHVTGKWEPGKPSVTVSVPVGSFDPIIGQTYAEISRTGLGFQRSQNGGPNVPLPAMQESSYHRFGSALTSPPNETSFFEGIDTSFEAIANLDGHAASPQLRAQLREIDGHISSAIAEFSSARPDAVASHLAKGKILLDQLLASLQSNPASVSVGYDTLAELKIKDRQFGDAMAAALQTTLEAEVTQATADDPAMAMMRGPRETFQMATRGLSFPVKVHLYQPVEPGVEIENLSLAGPYGKDWHVSRKGELPTQLDPQKAVDVIYNVTVPADEPYTRPYFTRASLGDPFYKVASETEKNVPLSPYPLQAKVTLKYQGATFSREATVQVVDSSTGPGILRYPMPVGPELSVSLTPDAGIIPLGAKHTVVTVRIRSNINAPAEPALSLALPSGWTSTPQTSTIHFRQAGEEQSVSFDVQPKVEDGKQYTVTAVARLNGKTFEQGYVQTGYQTLRPYFLYSPAKYTTTGTDVKMAPGVSVAYVQGSGDDVPAALEQIGVHVTYLSAQDLAGGDLTKFNTIVLGVRAYAVRPDLAANNARLLEYVHNGGVLIVQYNTPEFDHNFGPYPYVMTGDPEEVTDESSLVSILDAKNPVFAWPNAITKRDFDGWIEERGSKFMTTWDSKYTPLLETHDKGQAEQKGGLLYARYGKGIYIYNAYAFYRQLPLGVPGAFRIFANMLSLPKNPDVH
jgi:hypothetical protein